jgi:hypothetical protein
MYDTLLWQDQKWPALSLAWLPSTAAWAQPPALAAAEAAARQARQRHFDRLAAAAAAALDPLQQQRPGDGSAAALMDVDSPVRPGSAAGAAGQAAGGTAPQLVQMPVDFQYLLVGTQTSGQGAATVDVYRVELPGSLQQQVPPGPTQKQRQQQQVLMQKSDMQQVMVSEVTLKHTLCWRVYVCLAGSAWCVLHRPNTGWHVLMLMPLWRCCRVVCVLLLSSASLMVCWT